MSNNDHLKELLNAIGVLAETSLLFYRAVIQAGASEEGVSSVTVKDLKAKLSNIPEEASVEIVMCANDNPLSDGCRVNSVCYFEWLQKDGGKTVVLFPE